MDIVVSLLNDKSLKPKQKTETLSEMVLSGEVLVNDLIKFAATQKDPIKATCIESIEYATKLNPSIATKECLDFVTETLTAKAPRIRWESAKVIGNIASIFIDYLDDAIVNLISNTEHSGTVVRWSAAYALGEIIKQKSKLNKELLPAIEKICMNEEKNSIQKIYLSAIKKSQ